MPLLPVLVFGPRFSAVIITRSFTLFSISIVNLRSDGLNWKLSF
jgi:hypothetical protein